MRAQRDLDMNEESREGVNVQDHIRMATAREERAGRWRFKMSV
jgi:hypothetical protein